MLKTDSKERIQQIRLIVTDVDGVLTDGAICVSSDGNESKQFTVKDTAGAALARLADIPVALLSARYSEATTIRAREMRIEHCYQGRLDKLAAFSEICSLYNVSEKEAAFIGDGLVDLPVLENCGFAVTTNDGHPMLTDHVDFITKASGGKGVLQETIEFILTEQGKMKTALQRMRKEVYKA